LDFLRFRSAHFLSPNKTLVHKGFPRSQKIFSKLFFIGIALAKGTVTPDGSFRRFDKQEI